MIEYSILDPSKTELTSNITVRIDAGKFFGTFITFNPIKLSEDGVISYGVVIPIMQFEYNYITSGNIKTELTDAQRNEFLEIADDIFKDLLELFKGNISYD